MTKSRTVLAATFALALLAGGIAATGAAQAHRAAPAKPTTQPSMKPRTKNAALPTTTKPNTVTTPVPPVKPRVKNGVPKAPNATPVPTCGNAGCPTKPKKG